MISHVKTNTQNGKMLSYGITEQDCDFSFHNDRPRYSNLSQIVIKVLTAKKEPFHCR